MTDHSAGGHVGKLEPACLARGSVKWYNSQGTDIIKQLPPGPAIPLLSVYSRKGKHMPAQKLTHKRSCKPEAISDPAGHHLMNGNPYRTRLGYEED